MTDTTRARPDSGPSRSADPAAPAKLDLSALHPDGWMDALRPLPAHRRRAALNTLSNRDEVWKAMTMIGALGLEDAGRVARAREAARRNLALPAPSSQADGRRSLAGRQVNVRLRRRDFAALVEAARLLDTTHTALARTFLINGAREVLAARDRG